MSMHTTTDATDRVARTAGTPSLLRRLLQVTASGTTFVLAGSAFAAVGAYVFQLLGARMLGPTAFAPLSVLWTIQVLLLAVALVPLEQFVTRRLELTGGHSAELGSAIRAVVSLLGLCLVGVLVFVTLTLDTFFAGVPPGWNCPGARDRQTGCESRRPNRALRSRCTQHERPRRNALSGRRHRRARG
jgi:hypothetical protein